MNKSIAGAMFIVVFYIIGAFAAACVANMMWPALFPWAGILVSIVYLFGVSAVLYWLYIQACKA